MLRVQLAENEDGKFLVLENDTLGQHLLRGERWEPHFTKLVSAILRPGSTVVDAGANIGYNAVVMGRIVGDTGRVLAFEPLRIPYQQLCANAILNKLENVFAFNVALGHADNQLISMVPVNYHEENINIMNSCVGVGGEQVILRTLDSYRIAPLALLKVDVQGLEPFVLKGAEETIRKNRPVIVIEIEEPQLKTQNVTPQALMADILSRGYCLVWSESWSPFDWVAVPVEQQEMVARARAVMGEASQVFSPPA